MRSRRHSDACRGVGGCLPLQASLSTAALAMLCKEERCVHRLCFLYDVLYTPASLGESTAAQAARLEHSRLQCAEAAKADDAQRSDTDKQARARLGKAQSLDASGRSLDPDLGAAHVVDEITGPENSNAD
ncbi:hypothetical protein T492DRAFT_844860 [Pavlovales sp. CCMP2436]|nr:hypothetical protein T492DRAFT_844860 [Pavlovales sp. CCMP2436]